MRLFVALAVPDPLAPIVQRLQTGIADARWSVRENLHLTLRFLGEVERMDALALDAALAEIVAPPVTINLAGIGFFGREQPHAVYVGVRHDPALTLLRQGVERACRAVGLKPDGQAFLPHITLCYLPARQRLEPVIAYQQAHNLFKSGPWTLDAFHLYSSEPRTKGPNLYRIEASYPLTGRPS
jgi:2'-5' RNA ligase